MVHSEKLQGAWALYQQNDYNGASQVALQLLDQLSGADRRDALRLLGLSCLRQRLYPNAVRWLHGACRGNDDSEDWLILAMAAAGQGDFKLAEDAFEQVRLIQRVAHHGQGIGYYHQLYGYASALCDAQAHDLLLPLLEELASAYRRVGSTDTSLLYSIGLPFLASFLLLSVDHFHAAERHEEGVAWLSQFARGMDVETQRRVARAMAELRESGGEREKNEAQSHKGHKESRSGS